MKSCKYCGAENNDENKVCNQCNAPLERVPLKPKRQKLKLIFLAIFIVLIIVFGLIIFSIFSKEPTLKYCEELLGTPIENILSDDTYNTSTYGGVVKFEKSTDDVFGVTGKIVSYIPLEDEIIDILTWTSTNKSPLSESEIETFIKGMNNTYGKSIDESNDLWQSDKCLIYLLIDEDNNSLSLMFGLN
ncbi:MAG: hypothetical protein E7583_01455 [Ruminococcaceae bacterium]|nr:hypothetical protein [Oscillospiraceae bacterium]